MTGIDLKQEVMRVNNNVNIAMFGTGLRKQRVSITEDKIVISADHKRIPALAALDGIDRTTTRFVDVAILDEYKRRLKKRSDRADPVAGQKCAERLRSGTRAGHHSHCIDGSDLNR